MIREIQYNEIFDAQEHFRLILDSMSRPGKINKIYNENISTPEGLNNASALIGFALLNRDVGFYSNKNKTQIEEYFVVNTNSKPVAANKADFIFINGNEESEVIDEANEGLLEYPEKSATIIIDVEEIYDSAKDQSHELILKGPGVMTEKRCYIRNIKTRILEQIKEKNSEFPLGIDIILTDKQGNVICIPRSNQLTWN